MSTYLWRWAAVLAWGACWYGIVKLIMFVWK